MFDAYTTLQILQIAGLGLVAGTLGGMLGVGGSVVMIPGLVWVLGRPLGVEQHIYQASAMIANVAVSLPAALRHRRAGAMVPGVLKWMLPAALVCVVLGVWLSNLPIFAGAQGGVWLGRVLAVFLVYVVYLNVRKLWVGGGGGGGGGGSTDASRAADSAEDQSPTIDPRRAARGGLTVGTIMGTTAGLMGVGGGALAVPLQQTLLNLPLRRCIANSSAVICVSAAIGALYKDATLADRVGPGVAAAIEAAGQPPITWQTGLAIGLLLAPTAWAGGRIGASLTHVLPLRVIRTAFIGLMVVAAWKMAALPS